MPSAEGLLQITKESNLNQIIGDLNIEKLFKYVDVESMDSIYSHELIMTMESDFGTRIFSPCTPMFISA